MPEKFNFQSILKKLGLLDKGPEEHTLDKMNRLQVFAWISSFFEEMNPENSDEQRLALLEHNIFETLRKYKAEIR